MATPCISAFIVNYNTRDLLEKCIESLFGSDGDISIEVFVADNDSVDGSVEMLRTKFPDVFVKTHSENVGYTHAINQLLPLAKGAYYLLLHPDIEMLPHAVETFVDFFEAHPRAGVLGGNLYYPDGTPNPCEILPPGFKNDLTRLAWRLFKGLPCGQLLLQDYNPIEWSHKSTARVHWVWNACMMVRREVLDTVGSFDERFFVWYADVDICNRIQDAGWSVYYLREAIAIHHERQSFAKSDLDKEEVRYKVDGWHSLPRQIEDRYALLRKHNSPGSTRGVKFINIAENAFRLWLILGCLLFGRTSRREASFRLRACRQMIQAIIKA